MKVKVIERSSVEKEIDLEYPFYLYYQGDYALTSEYIKVDEKRSLHVNYEATGISVSIKETKPYEIWEIENALIRKKDFDENLIYVLNQIKQN